MVDKLRETRKKGGFVDWAVQHPTALACVMLMMGAFVLYANTFGHQWVYDDMVVLVRNPDIRSWGEFWQNSYPGRPLRELTYLLEYQLFGLNPAGYHVQNIFWHGLNAWLVYVVTLRVGGGRAAASISALAFLVHPLQVEVVANISHRKDSLALAFSLFAFLAYTKACGITDRRRWFWLVGALFLAGFAYLGKQIAVAVVPVFVAYEAFFVGRTQRILLRWPKLFCSAAVVAAAGAGWLVHSEGLFQRRFWEIQGVMSKFGHFSTVSEDTYLATLLKAIVFMAKKIVVPVGLGVEYSFSVPVSWKDPWVVAGAVLVVLFVGGMFVAYRRAPRIFFGLLWALVFWLPVSGLWPLTYMVADRYLYAPMAGLAIALGCATARGWDRSPVPLGVVVAGGALVLSVLTWQQSLVWRSPITLWAHAVEVSPESSYALGSLGKVYLNQGQPAMAVPLLRKAAENPFNQDAKRALLYAEKRLRFLRGKPR